MRKEDYKIRIIFMLALLLIPFSLNAHPGAKDRFGGHWDHKRNQYHCHEQRCTPPICSVQRSDYRCDNQYYGQGNYAPGGRNDPARYR